MNDQRQITERGRERAREEAAYEPVIIKRVDTARRHPDDILEHCIEEGVEQLDRRPRSLSLSAVAGGLMVTFSVMAVGVVAHSPVDGFAEKLLMAMVYPLGFIVCIMSGTELFTEHTATAVYPVLDRRAPWWKLVRLWIVVLVGNLLGAALGSALLVLADGVVGAQEGYVEVAAKVVGASDSSTLVSAILAGCLMALGGWLIAATPPASSQILVVYVVTFLIGLGGLHHSIAGSGELFVASMIGGGPSASTIARTIALSAVGNLLGGSLFVGILNYGHIRESRVVAGGGPSSANESSDDRDDERRID